MMFRGTTDGFDLRKVLLGRTGQSDGAENVVETLFAAVEDLVDLIPPMPKLAVGIDRELLDRRFAVVVPYGAGDAVAFGRGDARVVGHDPYLFIKGILAETHDLLAVAHAFVDARVVQGVGDARNLVDDQYVAAHQRVGNLEAGSLFHASARRTCPYQVAPFSQFFNKISSSFWSCRPSRPRLRFFRLAARLPFASAVGAVSRRSVASASMLPINRLLFIVYYCSYRANR